MTKQAAYLVLQRAFYIKVFVGYSWSIVQLPPKEKTEEGERKKLFKIDCMPNPSAANPMHTYLIRVIKHSGICLGPFYLQYKAVYCKTWSKSCLTCKHHHLFFGSCNIQQATCSEYERNKEK